MENFVEINFYGLVFIIHCNVSTDPQVFNGTFKSC